MSDEERKIVTLDRTPYVAPEPSLTDAEQPTGPVADPHQLNLLKKVYDKVKEGAFDGLVILVGIPGKDGPKSIQAFSAGPITEHTQLFIGGMEECKYHLLSIADEIWAEENDDADD